MTIGARLVWPGLLLVGTAAELRSLRRQDGATLSEATRATFRTHTPAGRLAFLASWAGLTLWFLPHICRRIAETVDDALANFDTEETP